MTWIWQQKKWLYFDYDPSFYVAFEQHFHRNTGIVIGLFRHSTATRDLQELVNIKALIKTGELKHSRYFLNLTGLYVISHHLDFYKKLL